MALEGNKLRNKDKADMLDLCRIVAYLMSVNAESGLKVFNGIRKEIDRLNAILFNNRLNAVECFKFCKWVFYTYGLKGIHMLTKKVITFERMETLGLEHVNYFIPDSWAIIEFKFVKQAPRFILIASWKTTGEYHIEELKSNTNHIKVVDDNDFIWPGKYQRHYYISSPVKSRLVDEALIAITEKLERLAKNKRFVNAITYFPEKLDGHILDYLL